MAISLATISFCAFPPDSSFIFCEGESALTRNLEINSFAWDVTFWIFNIPLLENSLVSSNPIKAFSAKVASGALPHI